MNYFGMLGFSLVFLGGSLFFGLLAWLVHSWWLERATRRKRENAMQKDAEYYDGLRESLLQHVDELIRKVDRP